MIEAIVIPVKDDPKLIEVNEKDSYGTVKHFLNDGWLEAVSLAYQPGFMYVDEEGLRKKLPPNPLATMLAGGRVIVGPAVVFGPADGTGEETTVDTAVKAEVLGG